jgi:hypothetical protein
MTDHAERDETDDCFDQYFGWCPECGSHDGYCNIGRDHWVFCDAHRTKWWVGSNLFSAWRDDDEATWERNAEHLAAYRVVDPHTPTGAMLERWV